MKFIYCYWFILDCKKEMNCVDDNRNENKTEIQNGDCDYVEKMNIPIIFGEFPFNIINFIKYNFILRVLHVNLFFSLTLLIKMKFIAIGLY